MVLGGQADVLVAIDLGNVAIDEQIAGVQDLAFGVTLGNLGKAHEDEDDDVQADEQGEKDLGETETTSQDHLVSGLLAEGTKINQEDDPSDEGQTEESQEKTKGPLHGLDETGG